MYFVLNNSDKLLYKLEAMKRELHGVDYLPPALDYADLMSISEEDWERALNTLLYTGDYTHVVIDLSETCRGFYRILDRSDSIYMLYDKGTASGNARMNHCRQLLRSKEKEALFEKIIEFSIPWSMAAASERFENPVVTPVGAYMKGILQ
jgi:hypothetical protein